ncbi:hypothetical protein B0H14DRAFT_2588316 [Mycena olivaceomarginata]|nr:hypothetical protein B0H14DRAFT_2588316 [Mycena olivaceomarginata]
MSSLAWILSVQCADLLCFVPLPGKFGILEHRLPQSIKVQSVLLSQSPLRNLAELPYFRGEAAVHEQIIASFASHHIVPHPCGSCGAQHPTTKSNNVLANSGRLARWQSVPSDHVLWVVSHRNWAPRLERPWLEHTTGSASSHVEDTTVAVASNTFGAITGPIKTGEA